MPDLRSARTSGAIRYAINQWDALGAFLDDANVPLDNNESESALRRVALSRKNFLLVGNEAAGENLAGLYSLVATCEANDVNPVEYLADALVRVNEHPELEARRAAAPPLARTTWQSRCLRRRSRGANQIASALTDHQAGGPTHHPRLVARRVVENFEAATADEINAHVGGLDRDGELLHAFSDQEGSGSGSPGDRCRKPKLLPIVVSRQRDSTFGDDSPRGGHPQHDAAVKRKAPRLGVGIVPNVFAGQPMEQRDVHWAPIAASPRGGSTHRCSVKTLIVGRLRSARGDHLEALDRIALVMAHDEGAVTHGRLVDFSGEHARMVTIKLQDLIRRGLLVATARPRKDGYRLSVPSNLSLA